MKRNETEQTPRHVVDAVTSAIPHWIDLFADKANSLGAHRHYYDDGHGGAFREESWSVPGYVSFAHPPHDAKTLREFSTRWVREATAYRYAPMAALLPVASTDAILDVISVTHHVCLLGRLSGGEAALYLRNIPMSHSLVKIAKAIYVTQAFAVNTIQSAKDAIINGTRT